MRPGLQIHSTPPSLQPLLPSRIRPFSRHPASSDLRSKVKSRRPPPRQKSSSELRHCSCFCGDGGGWWCHCWPGASPWSQNPIHQQAGKFFIKKQPGSSGGGGGEFLLLLLLGILSLSYHSAPTVEGPGRKHVGVLFHHGLNLIDSLDPRRQSTAGVGN